MRSLRAAVARTLQAALLVAFVPLGQQALWAAGHIDSDFPATPGSQRASTASARSARAGVTLAALSEEDLPATTLDASPSPTPAATATVGTPAASAGQPPAASGSNLPPVPATPSATASEVAPHAAGTAPGVAAPAALSDYYSLASEYATLANPARAASMRAVEHARQQLLSGNADEAIRTLGRALSIDSTNPYTYFYLGRAYLLKKNYEQAVTFFQRAEIGFASNPVWMSEACAFEGAADEVSGRQAEAQAAYKRALEAASNNQMAVAGYGRLAALGYGQTPNGAVPGASAATSVLAPAPAMPPPPPPPPAPGDGVPPAAE